MNWHWTIQPLAFVALLFALGLWKLNELPTDFCRDPSSPPILVKMVTLAGLCLPYTKAHIPSVLTSWELHALQPVASILPDPTDMVKNRVGKTFKGYVCLRNLTSNNLEIGKISAALEGIRTPESKLMMEAIENYDDQAKATIRSLSKLSYASAVWEYHHVYCASCLFLFIVNAQYVSWVISWNYKCPCRVSQRRAACSEPPGDDSVPTRCDRCMGERTTS